MRRDFKTALERDYTVRTAGSGEAALEALDDAVDVVLIGRRLPGMTGREVFDRLREEGYVGPVAMVCAGHPGSDIGDTVVDDYITHPVSRDELHNTIESLLRRAEYDDVLRAYYSVAVKIGELESEKSRGELETGDEYAGLVVRRDRLAARAHAILDELLERNEVEALFAAVVTGHAESRV